MHVFDRVIFFITSFLLLILSVILVSFAIPIHPIMDEVRTSMEFYAESLELGIVGLIILLIALRSIWGASRVEKNEEVVNQNTEIGEVKISLKTIESMVLRVAKNEVKGMKEVKSRIKVSENGLIIYLKGKVQADVEIPQVSEELQKIAKDHVESKAGVNISEVKVYIENIASDASRPK
ncbi:alkaline shock response membrane anchor protein AmaP [Natranaerobius trueperi]|uniref:Alkaline shock response membrane anchor protein AmaP n=1 Tax=Natranaerobius trueperi TaxID=759412 RepID=A0A226BZ15_9FIRM|nr:alkaline shock response membrane anchor protein AmaP [Natranaerobius trueperi]OWZ84022.1 hypothetical protein CDO51_05545 [Natranaerobius trueperi]